LPLLFKLLGEEVVGELGMGDVPRHQHEGWGDDGDGVRAESLKVNSHGHIINIAEVDV
jgi:hypothetical protein